jgi:predicted nucleotidyltransferase
MSAALSTDACRAVAEAAGRHRGLELLVLHGSRARQEAGSTSDWDFGFVARSPLEVEALIADLVRAVGSDRMDVVDLGRASALLRYRVARDGSPVYERVPGAFERFWLEAVRFWCDAAPVLERGYENVLARLDR